MRAPFEVIEHSTGWRLSVAHAASKADSNLLPGYENLWQQKILLAGGQILESEFGSASPPEVYAIGLLVSRSPVEERHPLMAPR
jgi:hypothetical protein